METLWRIFDKFITWVDKRWIPPFPINDEFGEADWIAGR